MSAEEQELPPPLMKLIETGKFVPNPNWIPFKNVEPVAAEAIAHKHPLQKPGNVPLASINSLIFEYYQPKIKEQVLNLQKQMQVEYFKMLYNKEPITAVKVAELLEEYGKAVEQPNITFVNQSQYRYPEWSGGLAVDYSNGLWLCTPCLIMCWGDSFPVVTARETEMMKYQNIDRCSICGPGRFNRKGYKLDAMELRS